MIKITQTITGATNEQIEALATDNGWTKQVMTTTESPNYPIDNPETALMFLDRVCNEKVRTMLEVFNLTEAKQVKDTTVAEAEATYQVAKGAVEEYVENIISVIVEPIV